MTLDPASEVFALCHLRISRSVIFSPRTQSSHCATHLATCSRVAMANAMMTTPMSLGAMLQGGYLGSIGWRWIRAIRRWIGEWATGWGLYP